MPGVTVALPVLNGGPLLGEVLAAVSAPDMPHELLVTDSGSTDGSRALARRGAARLDAVSRHEPRAAAPRPAAPGAAP